MIRTTDMASANEMHGGFMRLKQVLQILPIGKTAWYAGIKSGLYPKPITWGRSAFYKKSDIDELLKKIEQQGIQGVTQ